MKNTDKQLDYYKGDRRPDWETPQKLFDTLNDKYDFTLDPCSSHENAKCEKHYTKKEDGLSKSWRNEIVFMNPPYGREILPWVRKAHNELVENNTTTVGLLPSKTGPKWFQNYVKQLAEITYLPGRQKFGKESRPAPFDSILAIWENKANPFYEFLKEHIGHELVITEYPCAIITSTQTGNEMAIECNTCHTILHSEWEYPKEMSPDWIIKE